MNPYKNHFDVKKAGNRLLWRIKPDEKDKYTSFKPNENDFNALKTVLGHITRSKEKDVLNNAILIKLIIYVYNNLIQKYNTTILDDIPQKELCRILDRPVEHFYEAFESSIRNIQMNKMIDDLGDKKPTKEEFVKAYDLGFVTESLNHMVSECINRFA